MITYKGVKFGGQTYKLNYVSVTCGHIRGRVVKYKGPGAPFQHAKDPQSKEHSHCLSLLREVAASPKCHAKDSLRPIELCSGVYFSRISLTPIYEQMNSER
jgi:hypothetical protein